MILALLAILVFLEMWVRRGRRVFRVLREQLQIPVLRGLLGIRVL